MYLGYIFGGNLGLDVCSGGIIIFLDFFFICGGRLGWMVSLVLRKVVLVLIIFIELL